MGDTKRRCIGCMKEIDDVRVCPYCGFDDETPISKDYLRPRTLLKDRYLVGKPLRYNGEGVSYIGYDLSIDAVVEIREYFPDQLCTRSDDGSQELVINQGCETQFKALLIDFMELNETLIKMRTLTSLEQTYEVFEENNTSYAIKEHIAGVQLAQYLQDHAGDLGWDETFVLFEPLLKNIQAMHAYQILHRGISPETIRVTKSGEIKLCDFCIASARNIKTEISSQIYLGYAAPEQFSSSVYQGTWTDVYAVCAVLYRTLTGSRPPEVNNRGFAEKIIPPAILNQTVPGEVSEAIMRGLSQLTDNRTKTIGNLLDELSAAAPEQPIQLQFEEPEEEPQRPKRYGLMALLITAGVLAVVGTGVVIFALWGRGGNDSSSSSDSTSLSNSISSSSSLDSSLSSSSSSSSKSSSSSSENGEKYSMPNLVDQMFESVKNNSGYQTMFSVEAVYEYNEAVPKGKIFEQDVEANTLIAASTKVTVKVSKGSQYPVIPQFEGRNKDSYAIALEDLGIPYTFSYVTTGEAEPGTVLNVDPNPGSSFDLESSKKVVITVEQA